MYQIGDVVAYGGEGLCRVTAVGTPDISGISGEKSYYTLTPLYRDGTIFIPVDTSVFMRPAMSRAEAEELIRSLPQVEADFQAGGNLRLITEYYQSLMRSHDTLSIARLIKTIYQHQQQVRLRGGKPSQIDERYMKRAEELLYGELAYALGIPRDQVCDHIIRTIEHSDAEL